MRAQEPTQLITGARAKAKEGCSDEVVVLLAVVPTYSPSALNTHTSGEAVIEVTINSEGSVISAAGISGSPLLVGGGKFAASRWKFAATPESKSVRTVRLTFVYHLVRRDTPLQDLVPIFKPPYRVETTHVLPDETPSQ